MVNDANEDLSSLIHTKMQKLIYYPAEIYKLILDLCNYHPDVEIQSSVITYKMNRHHLVYMLKHFGLVLVFNMN